MDLTSLAWGAQHVSMSTITVDTLNFAKKLKEELATKRDLADAKSDIIRWVAGLLMAQAAIIAALVKLLAT